jgi:hypothetical protein
VATQYLMTIDTEEEWDWSAGYPVADLKVDNVGRLGKFQMLCERHGVATTYFANQAVFDDAAARNVLLKIGQRPRVEIGMHIHPWNTQPITSQGPVRTRDTYLHNLPDEVIRAKLNSVYRSFAQFGLKPTSFRGGRYSSGGIIHEFLRDRGFLADASVVPFTTWREEGAPDYRTRGLLPARLAPRHSGDQPLWEIPLTLTFSRRPHRFWHRCYDWVERSWVRNLRLIGIAERLGIVRKIWLNFEVPLGRQMLTLVRKLRGRNLPCVCFTVHSSSLVAGGNGWTRTQADEDRIFAQLDEVFTAVGRMPEYQPATVSEVARTLEKEYRRLSPAEAASVASPASFARHSVHRSPAEKREDHARIGH